MKKLVSFCLIICIVCSHIVSAEETEKLPYVIEPQYESALEFNKYGIAQVQLPTVVDEVGKVGVINLEGEKIFGFDDTKFVIRKNGLIMALGENDKAAFFSSEGKQLTDYVYETFKRVQSKTPHEVTYNYLTNRHDGDGESDLVPICRDGKFGFINSKGEETIAPMFDYVFGFYEGISKIGYDGNLSEYGTYTECMYGYINEKGEVLPTGKLWAASDFSYGYARIADGQYKVIDKNCNEVRFPTGDYEFLETNGNFILAGHDGGHVVLDMNGNILSDWAPNIQLFGKSFIISQKQIADINGNIIYTTPEDVRISFSRKGSPVTEIYKYVVQNRVSVQVDGLVNQDGKVVIEPKYKGLREVAEGLFWTPDNNSLFDISGNCIAEIDGYSVSSFTAYNTLSYKLLPVQNLENHKWGYVKLPTTENPHISKYTKSDVYRVYNMYNTDYGTVLYLQIVGAPHATGPFLMLVRENGEEINLSKDVSRETIWAHPEHNDIKVSEDGKTLTFSVSFDERREGSFAGADSIVLHEAGTYYYEADLETGKCTETKFVPAATVSEWAEQEVEKGIKVGFVPPEFKEKCKQNITREEFCELIYNLICQYSNEELPQVSQSAPLSDTHNEKIKSLWCWGIIKGKGTFTQESVVSPDGVVKSYPTLTVIAPDDLLTREEAAVIIIRTVDKFFPMFATEMWFEYSDINEISDWAIGSVQMISNLRFMKGVGNNNFAPKDNYTVEQAIATLVRVYECTKAE